MQNAPLQAPSSVRKCRGGFAQRLGECFSLDLLAACCASYLLTVVLLWAASVRSTAAESMQFDFDSAIMGYGAGQKFTSAGDAVVPSLTPRVSAYSQYPYSMQSTGSGFDKAAYDLPLKPLYDISGISLTKSTNSAVLWH